MTDYDPNYVPQKTYARLGQKAIVLDSQNRILILRRSEKTGSGGRWSLPGGSVDFGEEPLVSIQREIEEETKLKVADCKVFAFLSHVDAANDHIVMIGWCCRASGNEPVLNWEHDEYRWLAKEDALQLDLTEDGRFFVERFESGF